MKRMLLSLLCAASVLLANATEGALSGFFTINAKGEKVQFSQGNLQYLAIEDKWQFAENQYDIVGENNKFLADNACGWIDLFGWGTGDAPTKTSTDVADYKTFTDWGVNPISNGGNTPNQWRTLTPNEFNYLWKNRPNAEKLNGLATVNNISCYIFLPDEFVLPEGLSFNAVGGDYTTDVYSVDEWAKMEAAGAILLPVEGYRDKYSTSFGYYWFTKSTNDEKKAFFEFSIYSKFISTFPPTYGMCVRLVQDVDNTPTGIENADAWDAGVSPAAVRKVLDPQTRQILILRDGKAYNVLGNEVK